jgi:hypothetical protein
MTDSLLPPPTHPSGHLVITDDQLETIFRPISRGLGLYPWGGCMYETYGEELAIVHAMLEKEPARIWTVVDADFGLGLISGYHHVNRVGYLISEVPVPEGMSYTLEAAVEGQ